MTSFAALRGALSVKTRSECPMCGQDAWAGGDRLSSLPELESQDGGPPIDVLPFVCTHCGFVRLHSIQPLETIED